MGVIYRQLVQQSYKDLEGGENVCKGSVLMVIDGCNRVVFLRHIFNTAPQKTHGPHHVFQN